MYGEPVVTITGNLTADPELHFFETGTRVVNFTVASTPRYFDKRSGQYQDGEALFQRCNLWGAPAEHAAESLTRGTRVVVQGRLRQRTYTNRDDEKRTVVDLEVDEIGVSLRYATATVTKAARASSASADGAPSAATVANDPWADAPMPVAA